MLRHVADTNDVFLFLKIKTASVFQCYAILICSNSLYYAKVECCIQQEEILKEKML